MIPEPEEYELALRAREGDLSALGELVERTRLGLFRLAYALLGRYEDANDAVAAALLQVCLHVRDLRDPARMTAWMRSIVRNEAHRLQGRRTEELPLREEDAQPDDLAAILLRLDIERALRQLSPNQARVMRLFYLEELSVEEISRQTGDPAGTIKSWLHRGRRQLSRQMEGHAPMLPAMPASEPTLPQVVLVHTDLAPEVVATLTRALTARTPVAVRVLVPTEISEIPELLTGYSAAILDERLGAHSVFELLMHLKSDPRLNRLPLSVLVSDPSEFTAAAYFNAGVDRLVNKANAVELQRPAVPTEKRSASAAPHASWQRFTERARRVMFLAQEAAANRSQAEVEPEHLLLGLLREEDSLAGRILTALGAPPAQIRQSLEVRLAPPLDGTSGGNSLSASAQAVMACSGDEPSRLGHNYLGSEHLLLGFLAGPQSVAADVLAEHGITAERVREALGDETILPR